MIGNYKETFNIVGTNTGAIVASGLPFIIEDRKEALINNNLPHNTIVMANKNINCTLYIFLNHWEDLTKPDYVLFPSQQMTVPLEDGQHFEQVAVYNTHAVTDVAIAELKYKISTLKRFD